MKPCEYETTIEALGLSIVAAGRFLGVDERTSRRWVNGERDVPEPVARFLRYMLGAKVTPEEVEAVLNRKGRK